MRWQDRVFWPLIWLLYLGPIFYFFAATALKLLLAAIYDCDMSARGVSPCMIAGTDWGAFIHSGWSAGFAIVFFVIPWLIVGGLFVGFLKWADSRN